MNGRLTDYQPVEDRIRQFWADHPNGRIITELVHRDDKQYIVRAEMYTDRDDSRPAAVGYAEEIVGSSPVNKTNALENAETSAIGRCAANLGYAPKGARPSREEMQKAQRGNNKGASQPTAQGNNTPPALTLELRAAAAVDVLLKAATNDDAEAALKRTEASDAQNVNISGLLRPDDRETLGVDGSKPLSLLELAVQVTNYVALHGRAVRAEKSETKAAA